MTGMVACRGPAFSCGRTDGLAPGTGLLEKGVPCLQTYRGECLLAVLLRLIPEPRTVMSVLLGFLTLVAALLTLAVSATVFQLRSSDPAGNGRAGEVLAVGVILLWGTLAILLLLVALRQQRYDLPWRSINLYAFLLFALAIAGQLACLGQLTGRYVDGWMRFVLQLAVVVTPLAVLTHIAWRTFGVPVPVRVATTHAGTVVAVLSIASLLGFLLPKQRPREPDASSLSYPVLLVRDDSKVEIITQASHLTSMNTNYVLSRPSDPLVIDSHFKIYELSDLQLVKSSLGLLIRGQGVEPVKFRLVPYEPSGTPESVRTLVLRVKYLNSDSDKDAAIRRDLANAETLDEMIAILQRE